MANASSPYRRYAIPTQLTPDIAPLPPRFRVRVKKHRLIALAAQEVLAAKGELRVALSRPCVYGVFSRPVGGLAPVEDLCVGCLRCMTEYPGVVRIERNRARDGFRLPGFSADEIDTVLYEARTGRVPVRGAGYRGPFGGTGWDGIWLDMSEIVRPTRDGIHGREYISTAVDIGERPAFLHLDAGARQGPLPRGRQTAVPVLFGAAPAVGHTEQIQRLLGEAARRIDTLALVPAAAVGRLRLTGSHIVPLLGSNALAALDRLPSSPSVVLLDGWDRDRHHDVVRELPDSVVGVRVPLGSDLSAMVDAGVRVVDLVTSDDGPQNPSTLPDLVRQTHQHLVEAGVRDQVTLIGNPGVGLAEHVPKAIACGLDAVVLETPLWIALHARSGAEPRDGAAAPLVFPGFADDWGMQRIENLVASWRDQLLEVLGAMGLREVRRLRGELGRCLLQADLEREAFGTIDGYPG